METSLLWQGNGNEIFSDADGGDGYLSEGNKALEIDVDELVAARKALIEAHARQEAIEKERDRLLEELAQYEAKQKEYMATLIHDKEMAIAELQSVKSLFHQKLHETAEEKASLESKLVLAKQDAVELAVQVEKLAEIAVHQATAHILEDAQLRVSAAETSAAQTIYQIEEQIRNTAEGTLSALVEQSKVAIDKALVVAERAGDYATKSIAPFTDAASPADEIAAIHSQNIELQSAKNNLESQLLLIRSEIDKLKLELEQAHARANAYELRANAAEKSLLEFQESMKEQNLQQQEEMKTLLEKVKKDAAEKKKAASKALKLELENIKATIEAAKETAHSKDEAYSRRCEALQRSLRASETALGMWRERAEMAESLLLKEKAFSEGDEDAIFVVNGGRIDLLTDNDSEKLKLLSDGPRRELPEWMARRIRTICPKFPPRKVDASEALKANFISLDLPKPDEVWSIATEKPKEGDTLIEHVIEKEIIEKKRKALERALHRKTIQWQKTPEETKLGWLIAL